MSDEKYDFRCTECDHEWVFEGDRMNVMDVYDEPCPGCSSTNDTITRSPKPNNDHLIGTTSGSCASTKSCGRKSGGYFNNVHALKQNAGQHDELLKKIHEGTPGSKLNEKFK